MKRRVTEDSVYSQLLDIKDLHTGLVTAISLDEDMPANFQHHSTKFVKIYEKARTTLNNKQNPRAPDSEMLKQAEAKPPKKMTTNRELRQNYFDRRLRTYESFDQLISPRMVQALGGRSLGLHRRMGSRTLRWGLVWLKPKESIAVPQGKRKCSDLFRN